QDEVWRRLTCVARHYNVTVADILDHGFHISSLFGDDALLATVSKGGTITPTPRYQALLEAAGDIKPIMIGIASSACVFAGEGNNRSQVQQFVGLLTKIAIAANGAIARVPDSVDASELPSEIIAGSVINLDALPREFIAEIIARR